MEARCFCKAFCRLARLDKISKRVRQRVLLSCLERYASSVAEEVSSIVMEVVEEVPSWMHVMSDYW